MNPVAADILMHYGMPRRSGRYPWGSGKNPYQHTEDFLTRVEAMEKEGKTEKEIAQELGIATTQLRSRKAIAKAQRRELLVDTAKGLREKGYSLNEIAEKMGYKNDSSVRSLLNSKSEANIKMARVTADYLKQAVDSKGFIDVGKGVEKELGISGTKLDQALELLQMEGYVVTGGRMDQVTNRGQKTTNKVLCPPGTEKGDIYRSKEEGGGLATEKIHSLKDYDQILTEDGTKIRPAFQYPSSLDSSRIKINYAEDGGASRDGVIEIRRGVDDLSLGESHYAQVRILVDGTHYLKGMAVYSDNLPDGVDVVFNTNKKQGTPMISESGSSVLKPITNDPNNPFGALIKERGGQSYYTDADGNEKLSPINKAREEGDWGDWSNKLSAQFLSKQNRTLIEKQLNLAKVDKKAEYDEITSITNPTLKSYLLNSFADECDYASIHLEAAALPRQRYQVILPLTTIKDNEIYAPNYRDGEKVALIRYPHGGTFEIPILTVNNKQSEGERVITKNAKDAVGINSKVAERLSGADFDGDTVMVIPTGRNVKITSTPPLKGLEGFDPKIEYGPDSTSAPYKKMTKNGTQTEMGKISNLITDMTILGANEEELSRAVRHSMVVIDAHKHELDYKRSEKENGIAALKKKYQGRTGEDGKYHEGAATLISRAKAQTSVPKRKGSPKLNEDGSQYWNLADDLTYVNKKTEKLVTKKQKSTQMAETKDASTLISEANTLQEKLYADYANTMKSYANQARKEAASTKGISYSASANKIYSSEVSSLTAKANTAAKNAPRERQAQRLANSIVEAKKQSNPDLSSKELRKISQQALTASREKVGAKRTPIEITDKEWEAIQAGAISKTLFEKILRYTDIDKIKERATPRSNKSGISNAKISKIKAMKASGYTNAEIAKAVGVSTSTVSQYL